MRASFEIGGRDKDTDSSLSTLYRGSGDSSDSCNHIAYVCCFSLQRACRLRGPVRGTSQLRDLVFSLRGLRALFADAGIKDPYINQIRTIWLLR